MFYCAGQAHSFTHWTTPWVQWRGRAAQQLEKATQKRKWLVQYLSRRKGTEVKER